ncbi:hypothetical protein [Thermus thermophilus]|uniref:Uncharacterized protein n=1 Tax=Thermus thermophilus TaxID=274 RepID=A0A7R7TDH8_THETH|nr:hypothetical protein [Thermus thermophilus]BCP66168.1 hypothetical protein TthHB5018_11020 [Thermus thermophilus]
MRKAKAKPKWTERYEEARARWEEAEAWRVRLAGLGNKAVAVLEKALEEAESLTPEHKARVAALALKLALAAAPKAEPHPLSFAVAEEWPLDEEG